MVSRVRIFRAQAEREAREASTPARKEIGLDIADEFRSTAPRASGRYASSAHVEVAGHRVYVIDDDPDAFYKEYGTSKMRGIAALTKAARKFGKYSGFKPRGLNSRGGSRRSGRSGSGGSGRSNLVSYTTRSGVTRMVTRAQHDYFTRGGR